MNIELRSKEYFVDGMHVSIEYREGDIYYITIQRKDGGVLFSGRQEELEEKDRFTKNILEFLEEIL